MSKFKSLSSRVKRKILPAALSAAVAVTSLSIVACAEETASSDMTTIISDAGEQLKTEFVNLVSTLVPAVIGIAVVGLGIYGVITLFTMAKKFFKKAAG